MLKGLLCAVGFGVASLGTASVSFAQSALEDTSVNRQVALADVSRVLGEHEIRCRVRDARYRGKVTNGHAYEARCDDGSGYLVIDGGPFGGATDCLLVWATSLDSGDQGLVCTLPGNTRHLATMRHHARRAGITCSVDEALPIGRTSAGVAFEIGCQGRDGFLIYARDAGFDVTPCLRVALGEGATGCRFTTPDEQLQTLQTMLPDGAECDATRFRFMGHNEKGDYYELKCRQGDGLVLTTGTTITPSSAIRCEEGRTIGLTCLL